MIKVDARNHLTKLWGQLSPEQGAALAKTMMVIGLAILVRPILDMWPSTGAVLIRVVFSIAAVVCCIGFVQLVPNLRGTVKWFILSSVGLALNFSVMLANGGFMPTVGRHITSGIYCPLEGANLVYLGDWIWRGISPGDILLIVAFFGIIATMITNRRQQAVEAGMTTTHSRENG